MPPVTVRSPPPLTVAFSISLAAPYMAYDAAQKTEDVNERRRQGALPLRDGRYFAARVRARA